MSAFVKLCPVRTGQTKQNGCGGDTEMLWLFKILGQVESRELLSLKSRAHSGISEATHGGLRIVLNLVSCPIDIDFRGKNSTMVNSYNKLSRVWLQPSDLLQLLVGGWRLTT